MDHNSGGHKPAPPSITSPDQTSTGSGAAATFPGYPGGNASGCSMTTSSFPAQVPECIAPGLGQHSLSRHSDFWQQSTSALPCVPSFSTTYKTKTVYTEYSSPAVLPSCAFMSQTTNQYMSMPCHQGQGDVVPHQPGPINLMPHQIAQFDAMPRQPGHFDGMSHQLRQCDYMSRPPGQFDDMSRQTGQFDMRPGQPGELYAMSRQTTQYAAMSRQSGQFDLVPRQPGQFDVMARQTGQYAAMSRQYGQSDMMPCQPGQFDAIPRQPGQFDAISHHQGGGDVLPRQPESFPVMPHPQDQRDLVPRQPGQFDLVPRQAEQCNLVPFQSGQCRVMPRKPGQYDHVPRQLEPYQLKPVQPGHNPLAATSAAAAYAVATQHRTHPNLNEQSWLPRPDSDGGMRFNNAAVPAATSQTGGPATLMSNELWDCVGCGARCRPQWMRLTAGGCLCDKCVLLNYRMEMPQQPQLANMSGKVHQRRHSICVNCQTTKTTLWRRTVAGDTVCNACGLYFKIHGVNRPVSMRKDRLFTRKRKPKEANADKDDSPVHTATSSGSTTDSSQPSTASSNVDNSQSGAESKDSTETSASVDNCLQSLPVGDFLQLPREVELAFMAEPWLSS